MTIRDDRTIFVTMAAIDRELDGGFRGLTFDPTLEPYFEADTAPARERLIMSTGILFLLLYNLFLVSDWMMIPDMFRFAMIARLLIFTPCIAFTYVIVRQHPRKEVREGLSSICTVVGSAAILVVVVKSGSPMAYSYQYGTLLIMLCATVVLRLRFWYAAAAVLQIVVIQVVETGALYKYDMVLMSSTTMLFVTAGVLLLWATHALEWEQRRSSLLELRSHILAQDLDRMAKQDGLTGLWNRRHLDLVMATAWADARNRTRQMSAILFDIDHFKLFNDSQGHMAGDRCLRSIGDCVQAEIGGLTGVTAVRFGGEEFLVFIEGSNRGIAEAVAKRVQGAIRRQAINTRRSARHARLPPASASPPRPWPRQAAMN